MVSKNKLARRWDTEYHKFKEETRNSMEEWRLYECFVMYEIVHWMYSNDIDQEIVEWLWHDNITLDRVVNWYINGEHTNIQSQIEDAILYKFRQIGIDKTSKEE